jgi:hypothetical protein
MLHSYAHTLTRDIRTCKCIYAFARMYIKAKKKRFTGTRDWVSQFVCTLYLKVVTPVLMTNYSFNSLRLLPKSGCERKHRDLVPRRLS